MAFIFHVIYGMSSFPWTFIFFSGVGQPPTIGSLTDVFLGKWGNIWAIVGTGCFIIKAKEFTRKLWYCGWKKSCTTLDGWNPINNGINHLSTVARFLPSTVSWGYYGIYAGVNIQRNAENQCFPIGKMTYKWEMFHIYVGLKECNGKIYYQPLGLGR